ncbi:MAG: hypothetical protein IPJ18_20155 [Betaproteobacteria bacterium]|nr:hypothetical protein [Betaproteobacteria bacterium]
MSQSIFVSTLPRRLVSVSVLGMILLMTASQASASRRASACSQIDDGGVRRLPG